MNDKPKLGAWTRDENEVIAVAYLDMLLKEKTGQKYNKAQRRRDGLADMASFRDDGQSRSHGSWEMKCCNVSAVLRDAGCPWINGYKPLGHGQHRPLLDALIWAAQQTDFRIISRDLRRYRDQLDAK